MFRACPGVRGDRLALTGLENGLESFAGFDEKQLAYMKGLAVAARKATPEKTPEDAETQSPGTEPWEVVGPICESGDFLAKDRPLPRLDRGALIATFSAGAYGMVMASNYNTRPRAAEVLVDGQSARLVRRRETYEDLVRHEVDLQ